MSYHHYISLNTIFPYVRACGVDFMTISNIKTYEGTELTIKVVHDKTFHPQLIITIKIKINSQLYDVIGSAT